MILLGNLSWTDYNGPTKWVNLPLAIALNLYYDNNQFIQNVFIVVIGFIYSSLDLLNNIK